MRDAVILGSSIALMLVAVFIAIWEADRLHRAGAQGGFLRGMLWIASSLGLWFVASVVVGAAYQFVFDPQGPYPASVPIGFAAGSAVLVVWYRGKRSSRQLERNEP